MTTALPTNFVTASGPARPENNCKSGYFDVVKTSDSTIDINLSFDQSTDPVIPGMRAALLERLGVVRARLQDGVHALPREPHVARFPLQVKVDPLSNLPPILRRNAEHSGNDLDRKSSRKIGAGTVSALDDELNGVTPPSLPTWCRPCVWRRAQAHTRLHSPAHRPIALGS
ncbi:hypothetical protein [Mycobacterium sp. 050134]|uniref:hypothetical protein n=1 Tax=Mycobacterium sp. 050134 TaxID=3096111 RepID=UPI002ED9AE00